MQLSIRIKEVEMEVKIEDRVAIVTGAARGNGEGIARALAKEERWLFFGMSLIGSMRLQKA
jgi:hypothetical protein